MPGADRPDAAGALSAGCLCGPKNGDGLCVMILVRFVVCLCAQNVVDLSSPVFLLGLAFCSDFTQPFRGCHRLLIIVWVALRCLL